MFILLDSQKLSMFFKQIKCFNEFSTFISIINEHQIIRKDNNFTFDNLEKQ